MTFVVSPKSIAVGIFAGLASAVLVLSPVGGTMMAVPLTIVVQLPLVIAALGWGTSGAIIGVLAGTGVLLAISPSLALYFTLFLAPAAVYGSHLVGLAREREVIGADASLIGGTNTQPASEWYPLGRVLMIVALLVTAGAILVSTVSGFDPSAISPEKISAIARAYAEAMQDVDNTISKDQLTDLFEPTIALTLRLLPFAFTMTWTLIAAFNLGLGIWITAKSGNLLRPREDLAAHDLPRAVTPIFGVALVVSFLGGAIGAIAAAMAGAMAGTLLIAGLAVLHTVTRRLPFRLFLLILIYLFLGLFGLPLIIVGILEPYTRLRHRFSRRPVEPTHP